MYIAQIIIAIVPTACGIETSDRSNDSILNYLLIAIVPTACGIETHIYIVNASISKCGNCNSTYRLRY